MTTLQNVTYYQKNKDMVLQKSKEYYDKKIRSKEKNIQETNAIIWQMNKN